MFSKERWNSKEILQRSHRLHSDCDSSKHEIMVGRSDEVGKIYECYTTKRKRFLEPKRNIIQSKIIDICAEFGCYTNPWYSGYQEISLELHGDNVEFMLNELRKY